MSDARSAIEARNRRFVEDFNRGDIPSAVSVYTDDARIMPPGAPIIEGRSAIEGFWATAVEQMGIEGVDLKTVDVHSDGGSSALELGQWVMKGSEGELGRGTYMVHWHRDGTDWRWHWDIWNADA